MSESGENPVFTILLVDDKPRTMYAQKKRINGYLESKNFKLNWVEDNGDGKGRHVYELLQEIPVDIILLDNNISRSISGLDILKTVRKKHDLTDILFYSASDEHEIFEQASNFSFTVVIQGRDIADALEELIDKNLMKWDNIVFLRGMVISKIVELELKINEFFTTYFSIADTHIENFNNLILESGQGSLDIKRRGIMLILEQENLTSKFSGFSNLGDLQTTRNILAHGKLKQNEKNVLTVNFLGKIYEFHKKDMDKIFAQIMKMFKLIDSLTVATRIHRRKAV